VSLSEITQVERARWQRRAVGELAAILDAHRDLPVIAWTVAAAGATVLGHVGGLAPAAQVREVFERWRVALAAAQPGQTTSQDGTIYLRAAVQRNRVALALSATVFSHGEGEGPDGAR